jgi:hypothetical protein
VLLDESSERSDHFNSAYRSGSILLEAFPDLFLESVVIRPDIVTPNLACFQSGWLKIAIAVWS